MSLGISTLEMHLRQELPPLYGRDHTTYRSAYFPVKVSGFSDYINYLYIETFGPEHRPIVEFALDNIQTMKLQQQGFKRNKEDFHKNDNTNERDIHNKQSRKCKATGDALSVAGNRKKLKTSMSEVPKMEIN
ncbi:hypothetical protein BC332_01739 [Capsicum chinense]|nr:hypothetical protein BC332_01739 [Capsicum chinense]